MIEVKSATRLKEYHLQDIAIQGWVAEGAGVPLDGLSVAVIDTGYVYPGGDDYSGLLREIPVADQARPLMAHIPGWVRGFNELLGGPLPAMRTGPQCRRPFECPFVAFCEGQEGKTRCAAGEERDPDGACARAARSGARHARPGGDDVPRHAAVPALLPRLRDGAVRRTRLGGHEPLPAGRLPVVLPRGAGARRAQPRRVPRHQRRGADAPGRGGPARGSRRPGPHLRVPRLREVADHGDGRHAPRPQAGARRRRRPARRPAASHARPLPAPGPERLVLAQDRAADGGRRARPRAARRGAGRPLRPGRLPRGVRPGHDGRPPGDPAPVAARLLLARHPRARARGAPVRDRATRCREPPHRDRGRRPGRPDARRHPARAGDAAGAVHRQDAVAGERGGRPLLRGQDGQGPVEAARPTRTS